MPRSVKGSASNAFVLFTSMISGVFGAIFLFVLLLLFTAVCLKLQKSELYYDVMCFFACALSAFLSGFRAARKVPKHPLLASAGAGFAFFLSLMIISLISGAVLSVFQAAFFRVLVCFVAACFGGISRAYLIKSPKKRRNRTHLKKQYKKI